jgi:hypothetical protein
MGCFICCWLPFFILAIVKPIPLSNGKTIRDYIPSWLDSFLLWLGYCNSALNPIIYARFNREFRGPFIEILCFRCRGINEKLRNSDRKKMLKDVSHVRPSMQLQRISDGSTNYETYIKQKILTFNQEQTSTPAPTPPPVQSSLTPPASSPPSRTPTPTLPFLNDKQRSDRNPSTTSIAAYNEDDGDDNDDISLNLNLVNQIQFQVQIEPAVENTSPSLVSTRFYNLSKYPSNASLKLSKLDYNIDVKSLNYENENDKENGFRTFSLHTSPNTYDVEDVDETSYSLNRKFRNNSIRTLREDFYRNRTSPNQYNRSLNLKKNSKSTDDKTRQNEPLLIMSTSHT